MIANNYQNLKELSIIGKSYEFDRNLFEVFSNFSLWKSY